ncbi:hypothetical protein AK812_SmicGene32829 [Symbiodinium microadriaticum]|uniref:Uncharacterized protein n=1 Tax=Symbiodinium microadriaticum TaxID=2951 RepID=A0A1Q9CT73_SYMMI|nr:hypothetical protein AK812_SmicGene32829 [Symbiodinium microadriaticum]
MIVLSLPRLCRKHLRIGSAALQEIKADILDKFVALQSQQDEWLKEALKRGIEEYGLGLSGRRRTSVHVRLVQKIDEKQMAETVKAIREIAANIPESDPEDEEEAAPEGPEEEAPETAEEAQESEYTKSDPGRPTGEFVLGLLNPRLRPEDIWAKAKAGAAPEFAKDLELPVNADYKEQREALIEKCVQIQARAEKPSQ